MTALRLTSAQARLAWLTRQGLVPDRPSRTLQELLSDVGWIPSPSSASVYLALYARGAIQSRKDVDALVHRGDFVFVPGPRGTTCFVPTNEAPLARAFAVADHASREARIASSVSISSTELQTTRDALRSALNRPCTAGELRAQIPPACLRSLGDAGRKSGLTTLAALVLRSLWVNGEIMRVVSDEPLSQQHVRWCIDPRPRTVPAAADAVVAVASRWLHSHAPASIKAFALAFGIAAGRATSAFKSLQYAEIELDQESGVHLAPTDFALPQRAPIDRVLFLGLRDPLVDVHLDSFASADVVAALPSRGGNVGPVLMVNDTIVGQWSFDPTTHTIGWRLLVNDLAWAEHTARIDQAATALASFVKRELDILPLHTSIAGRPSRSTSPANDLSIEL